MLEHPYTLNLTQLYREHTRIGVPVATPSVTRCLVVVCREPQSTGIDDYTYKHDSKHHFGVLDCVIHMYIHNQIISYCT